MSLQSWLLLLVIYITYLIIGMFSFRALEYCEHKDNEVEPWMELRFDHSQNQTEKRVQWIMKQNIDHVIIGCFELINNCFLIKYL